MTTPATTTAVRSAATPGSKGVDWSFLGDETFWITAASLIGAIVTSVGLGHFATVVRAVIDAASGSLTAVYVAGKAHQRAKVITAAASAVEAGVAAVAPPDVAAIADQAAQSVIDHFSRALATANPTPSPAPAPAGPAPAAPPPPAGPAS